MVSVRKRRKVYEYRFEIATVEETRKWLTKSGYPTKAEAFKEGAKACNDFYYNGQKTQLRENISYADFLGLPAGHVDKGEDVYQALVREAREELNIDINAKDIEDTFVVNRINKNLKPYYDVYFVIKNYKGIIKINEPNKCQELKWVLLDNMPDDVIEFEKIALDNYEKGIKFSSIRIDEEKDMQRLNK